MKLSRSFAILCLSTAICAPIHAAPAATKAASTPAKPPVKQPSKMTLAATPASPGLNEVVKLNDNMKIVGGEHFTVLVDGAESAKLPDLIFIPGLSTPRAVWDVTAAPLRGRYRLHIVQIRGFGDKPLAALEGNQLDGLVSELATYINGQIISKGAGAKPKIIGHSLGGLTAMMVAARHPAMVDKAMIVDSLPFYGLIFGPHVTAETLAPQAQKIKDALSTATNAELNDDMLEVMAASEAGRMQIAKWSATADPKVTAQYLYDLMTTDIRPELANITAPLTILYPVDASSTPVLRVTNLYQAAFADAKGVKLERIADSRHFIMVDQPAKFAAAVDEFLKP